MVYDEIKEIPITLMKGKSIYGTEGNLLCT